jgi:hypothetical protein
MLKRLSLRLAIPAALALAGAAQTAAAAEDGPWSASFRIGTALIPHGRFQAHAISAGPAGTTELDSLNFDDVFRVGPSADLELGYKLFPSLEPFVRISYAQFRGQGTRIGDIHVAGSPVPVAVRGEFDDNESWAFDLGARWYGKNDGAVRPYLGGYVGVTRSDDLHGHVSVAGRLTSASREILLPDETRFGAGLEVGLAYGFADAAELRFSVGADYRSQRHENTDAYQSVGIDRVRVTDESWSLPIDIGLTWKF